MGAMATSRPKCKRDGPLFVASRAICLPLGLSWAPIQRCSPIQLALIVDFHTCPRRLVHRRADILWRSTGRPLPLVAHCPGHLAALASGARGAKTRLCGQLACSSSRTTTPQNGPLSRRPEREDKWRAISAARAPARRQSYRVQAAQLVELGQPSACAAIMDLCR